MRTADLFVGFCAGLIGGMGMGGGGVLLLYLTVFAGVDQLTAQGINLFFFLPIAFAAIARYASQKKMVWKQVIPMAAGGVVGALAGSGLSGVIGNAVLRKLFGVLLVVMGIKELFSAMGLHKFQKCDTLKKE